MSINYNFTFYLTLVFVVSSIILFLYALYSTKEQGTRKPLIVRGVKLVYPAIVVLWLIRSFWVQPYHIPTASLEPTILPGDFVLATQYDYGLHVPVVHWTIVPTGLPNYGDITVFRWPLNPRINYIKRVVGLPGDHIKYIDHVLYINDHSCQQRLVTKASDPSVAQLVKRGIIFDENLMGHHHRIISRPYSKVRKARDDFSLVVPQGKYFMMGDNRSASQDSRSFGAVPLNSFIGKARWVWMSADKQFKHIRWHRIGAKIVS